MGNSPTHAQRGVPSHEPYRTSDIDVDKGSYLTISSNLTQDIRNYKTQINPRKKSR